MKAITIIQPWATLIALGEKRFETRNWATRHRGPLAIHAGKQVDKEACMREPIRSALAKHGYTADNLPTGVVVATSMLTECRTISRPYGDDGMISLRGKKNTLMWGGYLPDEYHFGDYSDGRSAWELTDVKQLPDPIPAKGQQGLWNYPGLERNPGHEFI